MSRPALGLVLSLVACDAPADGRAAWLGEGGGAGRAASRFVTAATADIALIGDPHPENIGSFRGAGAGGLAGEPA